MPLNKEAAAARLIREMGASETTIADALVAASSLMHTAALAQSEFADAPALQTQSALLHLNKLLGGLIDARGEAMRVHSQLLDLGREMGATESPFCPKNTGLNSQSQRAA
jgi:hypothetical protein